MDLYADEVASDTKPVKPSSCPSCKPVNINELKAELAAVAASVMAAPRASDKSNFFV